jgi:pyridoxal phosphate enzyme (YggS family)
MSVADNLHRVQDGIARACQSAGRQPAEITLVTVSKTVEPARVVEAVQAGVAELGENWVQEAGPKRIAVEQLMPGKARWHMIGHLQTNKVKKALAVFDLIQGVDSLHLAREIDHRGALLGRIVPILLEVNTSGEASKFGAALDRVQSLSDSLLALEYVKVEGLMTIGPGLSVEAPEKSRSCFRLLRELRDRLESGSGRKLPVLSMGMSSDFAVAIQEGATMLRIGTAIFGARRMQIAE